MPTREEQEKFRQQSQTYGRLKDEVGLKQLEIFKYTREQFNAWHIGLAPVCFAIGGIAISIGTDTSVRSSIAYPGLFWWGSLLLILDGVLVFFIGKWDLEGESAGLSKLHRTEADLWSVEAIAEEHSRGDSSRAKDFQAIVERTNNDLQRRYSPLTLAGWTRFTVLASVSDMTFGLLIFPVLMLASQLLSELGISFATYRVTMYVLLVVYLLTVVRSIYKVVEGKKTEQAANQQIQNEVERKLRRS